MYINSRIHKRLLLRADALRQYRAKIDRLQLAQNASSQTKKCQVLDNLLSGADNRLAKVTIRAKPLCQKMGIQDKEVRIVRKVMSKLNSVNTNNSPALIANHENITLFLSEFEACLDEVLDKESILYKKSLDEADGTLFYQFD